MAENERPRRNAAPSAKQREIGVFILDGLTSYSLDDSKICQTTKKNGAQLLLLRNNQESPETLPVVFRSGVLLLLDR